VKGLCPSNNGENQWTPKGTVALFQMITIQLTAPTAPATVSSTVTRLWLEVETSPYTASLINPEASRFSDLVCHKVAAIISGISIFAKLPQYLIYRRKSS